MSRAGARSVLLCMVLVLAACASGSSSDALQGAIPTPSPGLTEPSLVEVPDVVLLTLSDAKSELGALGLAFGIKRKATGNYPLGTVISQSPQAGQQVAPGTRVTLTVAKGLPPPKVGSSSCDPSYPDVCIAPYPPDLDCGDIPYKDVRVVGSDTHGFDGDNDGVGCES